MNIITDLIPTNTPHNRRPNTKRKVEYIVVHNTGNPTSTAKNERAWLTNKNNSATASFNYVVDENDIIQCIPDLEVTWNAGDGQGKGNINGLSIEICESGNYKLGEQKAIELIAYKMVVYGLGIDRVKPHKFFSGKNCPRIILPYWDEFIKRVQAEYDRLTKPLSQLELDVDILVKKGIISSPDVWKAETYTKENVQALIHKVANYINKE